MSNTITVKALAQEARRLAQQYPDRVAVCSYTRWEDDVLVPNCIVGTAAYNLGISLEDLNQVNTCGIRHMAFNATLEWLDVSAVGDEVYVDWLSALQGEQDSGSPWGEALHDADRRLVFNQFDI